jgi:hypothetical protein
MSMTVAQIFATNPTTVVSDTDLYYLVQSPYTPGADAAITGASLKAAFGSGGTINSGLANQLAYYAAPGTTLSGLTTIASGVLVTSAGGAPSISTTLPAGLTIPGYAHSGANSDITSMTGLTGKLEAPTAIADTGGRNALSFSYAGAAVNYIDIANNNTGAEPNISAQGTDSDITMRIQSKGNKWLELISQTGTTVIKLWPNTSGLNLFKVGFDIPTITNNRTLTIPDASGTIALTSGLLTSPLTTKGDLWGWSTTNDRLPVGSTNGQVLQVNSAASLGLSYSTATYPTVATSAARILRADGTNWVQTTSTFADTYAASGFLYANGANNVAGLATANNGLPVTSNTGVPSILAGPGTTGNMLISNAAAAPSFTTFTYPTTVGATGSIHISNGTNIVSSTSIWPNTVGTARKVVISDGTSNVYSTETYAVPGSSGNIMTSDGTNWTSAAPAAGGVVNSGTAGQMTYYPATAAAVSGNANANISSGALTLGIATSVIGQLKLAGNTSGTVTITPQAAAGTFNFNLPITAGSTGQVLQSGGGGAAAMTWSTPTFPSTSGSAGKIIISDGTNNVYSTPTYPNASATTRKIIVSDGTNFVASTETWAVPGTNKNLLQSDGTNWASVAAIAASNLLPLGNSGVSAIGTTTYDVSTASGTKTITGLAFQPSLVLFMTCISATNAASWGWDNGTNKFSISRRGTTADFVTSSVNSVTAIVSSGNSQTGSISSFTSDGFVITFVKTGTPTGTADIAYLAFK